MKPFFVWTDDPQAKVRQRLAPVFKNFNSTKIIIGNQLPPFGQEQPGTILALGNSTLGTLQAEGVVPKGRTINSLRSRVFPMPQSGIPVMFSYSSGIGEIDYGKFVDLECDVAAALRLHTTGKLEPNLGYYRYVEHFAETMDAIEKRFAKTSIPVEVALDLETIGLDPYLKPNGDHPGAYIVTIQVSHTIGQADVVKFESAAAAQHWLSDFRPHIEYLLNSTKISLRGANLKFDLHWLAVHTGIECTNFKFDTNLCGSCLDENRSNGLDVHAKLYAPEMAGYSDQFDKSVDKSRMDLVLKAQPEELLKYAGGDTDACLRVAQAQKAELLADNALCGFYVNILHPAARAFELVERGGVLVDMEAYKELEADLTNTILGLIQRAKKIVGGRIAAKHTDTTKLGGLNLTKAAFLIDFMFSPMGLNLRPKMMTEGGDAPSTAGEHLSMFKDIPEAKEFVSLMEEYSSASKILNTYVHGFQKHIRSDGKLHPSYYFFVGNRDNAEGGAVTGRLSARDPAIQTIVKHGKWGKPLRRCFPAPPGHVVTEADYAQGELKVIACVANEPTMLNAYLNGMDLHALTGGRLAGLEYDQMLELKNSPDPAKQEMYDELRQLAKALNFGLIYGMGAEGFKEYAGAGYGVDISLDEAIRARNTFFDTYPGLIQYHEQYKNLARMYGYVRSPLGRIRHLPLIKSPNQQSRSKEERRAVNSPIQSTLSDCMIWAIALYTQAGHAKTAPCFCVIHDASYNYVPEDQVEKYGKLVVDSMENLPFERVGWQPQLRFTADIKAGKNMADLQKLKL
jgi:DNA polymerase I-like protein with 3'-5' exonuclease and polymerase domains